MQTRNILLFNPVGKNAKVSVFFQDATFWLTQKAMAELFGVNVPAVSKHLKNILESGELAIDSVISKMETTASDGKNYETIVRSSVQEKAVKLIELKGSAQNKLDVKAPMPGMVLKINKKAGDEVEEGESVLILEAMKMENDLRAHISGKIKHIYINEGMTVEKGYTLFTIEQ